MTDLVLGSVYRTGSSRAFASRWPSFWPRLPSSTSAAMRPARCVCSSAMPTTSAIPALLLALWCLLSGAVACAALVFLPVGAGFPCQRRARHLPRRARVEAVGGPRHLCGERGSSSTGGGGLLKDLATTRVVRCDEAHWRIFGLSLAGWNVVVCADPCRGFGSAAAARR